ncbi:uncharacterized protein Dana_GF12509 [Drosophila ananassae]|uniref:Roadblock/LAMTOR2 domain-containing protein n=1 Tax=Drosophila ananassae TaxID=7217 RepID=B3ME85_DROAN|nr:dynein light chain roadblock-type 1 [Drosophila ananassae]EDV35480.2 uncharacterized protein Dana_GF12509 [Drosophila ananassae]
MQAVDVEPKRTKRYVEEVFSQIQAKPGVEEILIMNHSGVPVKTSMERQEGLQYACLYDNLREKCQAFLSKMEPPQTLTLLRVRTKYNEVLISPDAKITVLVVQNAKDTFLKLKEKGATMF